MAAPKLGTYVSEDQNFTIQISRADASQSQLDGSYKTTTSPEGPFQIEGEKIGTFYWIPNKKTGESDEAPCIIGFSVVNRPEGWPYCIKDTWTGCYQENDKLLMDGSRSYVNNQGVSQTMSLGTLTFSVQGQ